MTENSDKRLAAMCSQMRPCPRCESGNVGFLQTMMADNESNFFSATCVDCNYTSGGSQTKKYKGYDGAQTTLDEWNDNARKYTTHGNNKEHRTA